VRSHGLLVHLLDHDADDAIEQAWMDQEALQRVQLLASVRFDVFEKIKRKILLYSDIAGLFGYHILLNVVVGELACNLEVVYMPLAGNGQPRKVIGEPESFLTRH